MLRIAICVTDNKTYDLIKKLYECISEDTIKIYIFNIKDESINNFNEADYDRIFFVHENATESIVLERFLQSELEDKYFGRLIFDYATSAVASKVIETNF